MGVPLLYHHGMSVCAAKVRMVLIEKEIDWEGQYVDIRSGESHQPEYLKLNPKGVVPTLIHDGNVIQESTVICEYLEDTFADPSLVPPDPASLARMRIWTKQIDEGLHFPSIAALTFAIAERQGFATAVKRYGYGLSIPEDQDINNKDERLMVLLEKTGITARMLVNALQMYDKYIEAMEGALETSPWLTGDMFTLADIGIVPYIQRLDCMRLDWLWQERSSVADWYDRIRSRASYKPAILDWFDEKEINLMEENGAVIKNSLRLLFEQAAKH